MNTTFKQMKDIYSGIAMAVFGVVYLTQVPAIRVDLELSFGGSKLFPLITGIGLITVGIIVAARCYLRICRHTTSGAVADQTTAALTSAEKKAGRRGIALTFLYLAAYSLMLERAGFLVATALYLFAMIFLLAPQGHKRPIRYALIALAADLALYLVFTRAFDLILPRGFLGV